MTRKDETNPEPTSWKGGAFFRFLLSGGFNTAATYVLYLLLLYVFQYQVSYTITYVLGIVLAYYLNRFFVFRAKGGLKTIALFPLVYLVQYLVGLGVLSLWVEILGLGEWLAPVAACVVTIPLTFLLSRWIFSG